jgi:hypothetical protein
MNRTCGGASIVWKSTFHSVSTNGEVIERVIKFPFSPPPGELHRHPRRVQVYGAELVDDIGE